MFRGFPCLLSLLLGRLLRGSLWKSYECEVRDNANARNLEDDILAHWVYGMSRDVTPQTMSRAVSVGLRFRRSQRVLGQSRKLGPRNSVGKQTCKCFFVFFFGGYPWLGVALKGKPQVRLRFNWAAFRRRPDSKARGFQSWNRQTGWFDRQRVKIGMSPINHPAYGFPFKGIPRFIPNTMRA